MTHLASSRTTLPDLSTGDLPAGWTRAEWLELVSALTRRRALTSAAAAALLAGLPGLAGAQSTPIAGSWPRTITGSLGEVVIPAKPERILCLSDWGEVDYLMAMGVKPVTYGFTNRYGQGVSPWLTLAGGDTLEHYDLAIADGADLEIVAAANPDLIVSEPYFAEKVLAQLSAIAPTLGVPTTYTGATWRDAQTTLGLACGTETAAAQAISDTDRTIAEGKAQLTGLSGRAVTIAYFSDGDDGSTFTVVPKAGAGLIEELGLAYNGYASESSFDARSIETINQLSDADLLIVLDFGMSETSFTEEPLFQTLPVAKDGRYAKLDVLPTRAFWGQTSLSVRWCVPFLVEAITNAAK